MVEEDGLAAGPVLELGAAGAEVTAELNRRLLGARAQV
jgi:hypothetical protein